MKFLPLLIKEFLNKVKSSWSGFYARFRANVSYPDIASNTKSVTFEISMLHTFILGLILLLFSIVLYLIISSTLFSELDYELKLKAQEVGQSIRSYIEIYGDEESVLMTAVTKTVATDPKNLKKWWLFGAERRWMKLKDQIDVNRDYISFVGPDGVPLAYSASFQDYVTLKEDFHKVAKSFKGAKPQFYDLESVSGRIRVINYPFQYNKNNNYIIQVGVSPQPIIQTLQNWLYMILLSIPVILILTSFVGRILASRILRPVEKITETAHSISYQDLSSRIEPNYYYKEMNSLIEAFNDMFSRLEKSFNHIEEFGSHVAHELKTPLAIIKGEIEVSIIERKGDKAYQKSMAVVLEEVDKMLATIDDLLYLAKLDYQPDSFYFEEVEIVPFLTELIEHSARLAKQKGVHLKTVFPAEMILIKADRLHLRRLFFNLLDNALKFTPRNGEISVAVEPAQKNVKVLVRDNGPGIPPEDLDKIFKRFFQTRRTESGTGLGLNIAQTIAKIHQGEISIESKLQKGTIFIVRLPRL